MRFARSALLEPGNDLFRYGCRFQPRRIVRMTADQHTGFERLDRQSFPLEHLVGYLEARTLETLDPALDRDPVAMGRRDIEFRPRVDHRNADQAIFLDDVLLRKAGRLEHDRGRVVEHLEIARVIDDVGGVAVTPLDLHIPAVDEHAISPKAFSSEVETGSRQENASNQESRAPFRLYRNEALARRHAKRGIEPHHLAVQVWIVEHVPRPRGELVGMPEPARKRYRRGQAVLRLLRQIGQ